MAGPSHAAIITPEQLLDRYDTIIGMFFLFVISAVGLLVGGVGVEAMM